MTQRPIRSTLAKYTKIRWGVISAILFARRLAKMVTVTSAWSEDRRQRTYTVSGQLFFVSTTTFLEAFDFGEPLDQVVIDLRHSHVWDHSAVDAIDKVVLRFRRSGAEVKLVGLNEASASLLDRLAVHDKEGALEAAPTH